MKEGSLPESGHLSKSKEDLKNFEQRLEDARKEELRLLDFVGKVKNGTYALELDGMNAIVKNVEGAVVYSGDNASEFAYLSRFYDDLLASKAVGDFIKEETKPLSRKRVVKINGETSNTTSSELIPGEEESYNKARMLVRDGGYTMDREKDGLILIKDEQGKSVFMSPNGEFLEERYRGVVEVREYTRLRQSAEHGVYIMEENEREVVFKDTNGVVIFASNAPIWLDSIYERVTKGRDSEIGH